MRALVRYKAAVTAAALACAGAHASNETKVELSDLSSRVLEAAYAAAPGVEFERVTIEMEGDLAIYEFEATGPDGKHIEVDITEDGELQEIELELSMDEAPEAVVAALEKESPGFTPTYIEASIRPDGVFLYEFEGVTAEGVETEIEISETGRIVSSRAGPLT